MLNTVFQLTAPRRIEVSIRNEKILDNTLIVRPRMLSICHADQRYYQGSRPPEIMDKKLPMALIHEAIGEVVLDRTDTYKCGDMVVMIPNTPFEDDEIIAENYLRSSKFRASSMDGFMQELVFTTPNRVVHLPKGIDLHVAAFTELVSVAMHAIERLTRFSHERRDAVGIWGDGRLGFITALLLKNMFPNMKLYVFGLSHEKLSSFTFVNNTFLVNSIPDNLMVDHAFECAGGSGCAPAISQIIDHINPEGTVSLLGVSENPVPINTRMVLEKGLILYGSSRSGRNDYDNTLKLYEEHPSIPSYLRRIVGEVIPVRNVSDMDEAFDADIQNTVGKTIMEWLI